MVLWLLYGREGSSLTQSAFDKCNGKKQTKKVVCLNITARFCGLYEGTPEFTKRKKIYKAGDRVAVMVLCCYGRKAAGG